MLHYFLVRKKNIRLTTLIVLFGLFHCIPLPIKAQDLLVERLLEQNSEFSDQSSALDFLEELARKPLPINTANREDFLRIPGLTVEHANRIIAERNLKGSFQSLEEFRIAGGIFKDLFDLISDFLTLNQESFEVELVIRQRIQRRVEESAGYQSGGFAGSSIKNYTRISTVISSNISAGALIEKDPGEKGYTDHAVGYLQYVSNNNSTRIIAGNYSLSFGQGLIFSRKSFFGKSSEPVSHVKRNEQGGRGYLSSSESEGFFGVFGEYSTSKYSISLFGSAAKRDARINSDGEAKSIATSGFHRTDTELNQRNRLEERLAGGRLRIVIGSVSFGISGASIHYQPGLSKEESGAKFLKYSGNEIQIGGFDFSTIVNNLELFGEIGVSNPGSAGYVGGIKWGDRITKIGLLYRNYARDFYSQFGSAFADNSSGNRNERGLYLGIKHKMTGYFEMGGYTDIFSHAGRSTAFPVKENGKEYFLQIRSTFKPGSQIYINWRARSGLSRFDRLDENNIRREFFGEEINERIRLQGDFELSGNVRLGLRIEAQKNRLKSDNSNFFKSIFDSPGILLTAKTHYENLNNFKLTIQATIFSSKGTRLYQYEPDLPGLLKVNQFTGKGARFAVIFARKIGPGRLTAKYGIVHFPERDSFGSGVNAILQNYIQDIGIQWDLNYN